MNDKNTPRTVIGPETVINGEIHSTSDLVVQGRVSGSLQVDAVLFIEAGGVVEAQVNARHAVIAGSFKGDMQTKDALEVAKTGQVRGRVQSPRMLVSDGASVNAEISMSGEGFSATAKTEIAEASGPAAPTADKEATAARPVYTYTVPAVEQAPDETADEDEVEVEVEDVVEVTASQKKDGKKKRS